MLARTIKHNASVYFISKFEIILLCCYLSYKAREVCEEIFVILIKQIILKLKNSHQLISVAVKSFIEMFFKKKLN